MYRENIILIDFRACGIRKARREYGFAGPSEASNERMVVKMSGENSFREAKVPSDKLEKNVAYIKELFEGDDTLLTRYLTGVDGRKIRFCLIYVDGMVNNKLLNEDVIRPLIEYRFDEDPGAALMDVIGDRVLFADSVEKTQDMEKIIQGIVYGDTVLFAEGCVDALILNTKGFTVRSVTEPDSERVLRGPREGFNESILMNLSLVRRKIRTPDLKMKFLTFGKRTRTKACICYLDSVVNKDVLKELEERLKKIDIDGTLDTNYITEIIKDYRYSSLKTIGSTERPDVVSAKLLEGRVALFLDGTPVVLTLPHLFIELFQSDEDYYINFIFTSIGRLIRILSAVISLCLPAGYVALVAFHQEMLPAPLLMSILGARQGVPFPTALETIFMLVVFEILRESGSRMEGNMGQTLSILGALVIGQAAVDAKIVSAPIIIVVAFAGITGLMVPRMKGYIIVHRFLLLVFSCVLGLFGLLLGLLIMLAELYSMTSFGVPIMSSTYTAGFQDQKDLLFRAPWPKMIKRPRFLSRNRVRQAGGKTK